MALQANGITVLRVGETTVGDGHKNRCIEFLVGPAQVKLVWDTEGSDFLVRQPLWSDGRRNAWTPQIKKAEWKEIFRQAYGIANGRGWVQKEPT